MATHQQVTVGSEWTSGTNVMRTWGAYMSTAFEACGATIVSTPIDWPNVTINYAPNIVTAAEIRKLPGDIPSKPLYLRVTYGFSAGGYPQIGFYLGTGYSGTTLTGIAIDSFITWANGNPSGIGLLRMCGVGGDFWLILSMNTWFGFYHVSRRKNQVTGAVNPTGDFFVTRSNSSIDTLGYYCYDYDIGSSYSTTGIRTVANATWTGRGSGLANGDVTLGRAYGAFPAIEALDSFLIYRNNEIDYQTTVQSTVFTPRTYLATGWAMESNTTAYYAGVWE